jgi:hypothetical protein
MASVSKSWHSIEDVLRANANSVFHALRGPAARSGRVWVRNRLLPSCLGPPDRRKLAVATHYEVRWLASAIVSLPEHDRRFAE